MKIGYVKIRQADNNIKNLIKFNFYKIFNIVNQDIDVFWITRFNDKSKNKLVELLEKNKIDYALVENDKVIDYPTIDGSIILKYMLPETIEYCIKSLKPKSEEVYICSNKYTSENNELIEEIAEKVKVVNILTENTQYNRLEKDLESKQIYITVSANKRKSLKKANIVINLDFDNLNDCNINRNMIFIDVAGNTLLPKAFEGILIKKVEIDTKKIMRIFSEFENFNKAKLIESEMLKLEEYKDKRNFIKNNKIYLVNMQNKTVIDKSEFNRIAKSIEKTLK